MRKFARNKLSLAVIQSVGAAVIASLAVPMVYAQQTPPSSDTIRVEVTGSSIKRLASEQALPVQVLNTDDLAKSGVTNAEQAMQFVTANQSGTVSAELGRRLERRRFVRRPARPRRVAHADPRQRPADGEQPVPFSAAVDINALPFGAVERIEVLTDGASAVYGTDAISGVVNFITKKEYKGASVFANGVVPACRRRATGARARTAARSWLRQPRLRRLEHLRRHLLPDPGAAGGHRPRLRQDRLHPVHRVRQDQRARRFRRPTRKRASAARSTRAYPNCAPATGSLNTGSSCRFDYVPFIAIVPSQNQAVDHRARARTRSTRTTPVSLEYIQARQQPGDGHFADAGDRPVDVAEQPVLSRSKGITPGNTNPNFDPTNPISPGRVAAGRRSAAARPRSTKTRSLSLARPVGRRLQGLGLQRFGVLFGRHGQAASSPAAT